MNLVPLPDPVRAVARAQPEAPAVVASGETVTYAELDRRVGATAARLHAAGLERGDRLAVYRPTDVSYLVLLLAAFRAGVVICPLSTRQPPGAVPTLLDRIACRTLAATPDPGWSDLSTLDLDTSVGDTVAESEAWSLDAPATLVFTSGSTGTPKAALHTLGNHIQSARGLRAAIPLGLGDRWLLDLPLYHVGGLAILFRCVLAGAAVVLPGRGASADLASWGVTHVSWVATQLMRTLRDGKPEALSSLKAILLGGSAIPSTFLAEAQARGLPVYTSYGMTEMASTVTVTPAGASSDALATSGSVLPHREVRLADDGEICVRGSTLFAGYVVREQVERPDAGDGWFPTGDLGAWALLEEGKMLQVVGRKDNLFISGGENVQPEEVEAALGQLGGVRRAVVVPVADHTFGQRPAAFVEAERWEPERWRADLAVRLPGFKVPVAFHPWLSDAVGMKPDRQRFARAAERLSTGTKG